MNLSAKRKYIEESMPEWFADRIEDFNDAIEELTDSPDNGKQSDQRMLTLGLEDLQIWYINKFTETGLKSAPDYSILALDTRIWLTNFLMEEADYGTRPGNPGGYHKPTYGFLLSTLLSIGWREQAEMVARIGIEKLNTFMNEGISPTCLPWFMLQLTKDWLGVSTEIRSNWGDIYIKDLKFWDQLLAGWRNPNISEFSQLFYKAADFHVEQSQHPSAGREDEDTYEIGDELYWLFPVELFAVLRLREWEGLPNPDLLEHPLFTVSALGKMPPVLGWPASELMDEVEQKFRRAYPQMREFGELP